MGPLSEPKAWLQTGKDIGMYQACIFDLDGTLCDTVESIAYCANRALRELGMREASFADYKIFVGDGVDMLVHRLCAFGGDTGEVHFAELKEKYVEYFREGCMYRVKPYPNMRETLEQLKRQGAMLGVISNKPHANTQEVIRRIFGEELFDWVQGQTEELPRKPDPAGALYTAEKLGVSPENCLYIGDTGTDMRTGTAAGMYTVGVLWGFRDREELEQTGACAIIKGPEELSAVYESAQDLK